METLRRLLPDFFKELPLYPTQASTVAGEVDALYLFWVGLSLVISVVIFALIVFFAIRYRRRHPDDIGSKFHKPVLEYISMGVPFVVAMAMFAWGTVVYFDLRKPPADAIEYFAFGKQWMWKYQHPNGLRQINDLTIPADTPIKMTMTSEDVIHAFFIPAFRVKQDVIPGRYTTVWFEATKPGTYRLFCAEYCGSEHSLMGGKVHVLERDEYEAWLREESEPTGSPASSGEDLFTSLACSTCHAAGDNQRGPSLRGLFGTEVRIAGGNRVLVDEGYLRESILEPRKKVRLGWEPLMPTFAGQLSEEQLFDLVQYIKSLDDGDGQPALAEGTAATTAAGG